MALKQEDGSKKKKTREEKKKERDILLLLSCPVPASGPHSFRLLRIFSFTGAPRRHDVRHHRRAIFNMAQHVPRNGRRGGRARGDQYPGSCRRSGAKRGKASCFLRRCGGRDGARFRARAVCRRACPPTRPCRLAAEARSAQAGRNPGPNGLETADRCEVGAGGPGRAVIHLCRNRCAYLSRHHQRMRRQPLT